MIQSIILSTKTTKLRLPITLATPTHERHQFYQNTIISINDDRLLEHGFPSIITGQSLVVVDEAVVSFYKNTRANNALQINFLPP